MAKKFRVDNPCQQVSSLAPVTTNLIKQEKKRMKLDELKEKISILPWIDENVRIRNQFDKTIFTTSIHYEEKADTKFATHAANNFFELVEALESTLKEIKSLEASNPMLDFERDFVKEIQVLKKAQEVR